MNDSYYQYQPPVSPIPPRPAATGKDRLFALLFFLGCVICIDSGLFGGFRAGHTVSMWILVLCYVLYCGLKGFRLYSSLCVLSALISSIVFTLYNDEFVLFILYILFFVLMAAAVGEAYGINRHPNGSYRTIADIVYILFACPFLYLTSAIGSLFTARRNADGSKKRASGILPGLLCSIPVLLIVVPLLISADAAFESFLSFLSFENLFRLAVAVFLGTILFLFLYSHAFGSAKRLSKRTSIPAVTGTKGISGVAPTAFLGSISCFYLLYLISQLSYFFSAFAGALPAEFSTAEYARRGFSEMCIVCVINLLILFVTVIISRREAGKIYTPLACLAGFVDVFSIVLIATALSKMVLYMNTYGLTRLRFGTSAFMVILLCIFVAVLIRLFCKKFPYVKIALLATAFICMFIGFADINTVVARYNTNAYLDGKLETVDIVYLDELGDSAVPYLLDLTEAKDKEVSERAKYYLNCKYRITEPEFDIREFNFNHYRAQRLLEKNKDIFVSSFNLPAEDEYPPDEEEYPPVEVETPPVESVYQS